MLQGLSGITPMTSAPWAESTFWMYTVLVDEERFGITSRQLMRVLQSNNIQSRPLWQPIHQSPAHALNHADALPVAEKLARQALSLPSSVGLTERQQDTVIDVLAHAGSASEQG
jgi:dTDP-4-amino-4,6-dideoxygalactose transaminase